MKGLLILVDKKKILNTRSFSAVDFFFLFDIYHRHNKVNTPLFIVHSVGGKSLEPSDCSTQNQGMDVMCAFICVDSFQIHNMSDDVVFI